MGEWVRTTLGECGKWFSGGTPSKKNPQYWDGDIPWISAKSMHTYLMNDSDNKVTELAIGNGTRLVPPRTILLLVRGSMLLQRIPMGITTRDIAFNQDVKAIITHDHVIPEFLFFWLLANEAELLRMVEFTGIGAGKLSTDALHSMELLLPPLKEQELLLSILSPINDKIESNRRMNETLENTARAIFKSWFVDFDPVHAKANGEIPEGMSAETADLFPDEFQESELGLIPRGWSVGVMGDHVNIIKGRSYKSVELEPSDTALVSLKSFERGGGYKSNGLKSYTGKYKPEQIIDIGEIVVAYTDVTQKAEVIGRPAIVQSDPQYSTLVASLDMAIIRPKDSRVNIPYLYYLFLTDDFTYHILGYTNGSTVLHLAKDGLPLYEFTLPTYELVELFYKLVNPLFKKISINLEEIRTLAELRDTLLPCLISGELRVEDVSEFVGDL